MIMGPFDSAVRSLLVGIIELGVEEVMVIGHTDCGVSHINADMMIQHLIQRGISQDHIDMMRYCGIDFEAWLCGFDSVSCSVEETVDLLRNHPLMPTDVVIKGYIIDTETGELTPQC
jgi:carbonic anhydrase